MNKRIENLVKRIKKNDGKSVTLRRDILVKMAEEQLFDYMNSYSYDETFGVSEGKGIKGDFTKSCEDVRTSSVGFCYVSIVDNKLKFACSVHSNRFFDLYIELKEDKKGLEEVEISEDVKVELNEEKNGVEIYFSSKPSEEVRNNLKSHGFRWSKYNKCWYAKQSEDTLNFANSLLPKEDDKINDLSENTEVAITYELSTVDLSNIDGINENEELEKAFNSIKLISNYYLPTNIKFEKSFNGNFYTFSFHIDKNLKSQIFVCGSNEDGKMKITTNFAQFDNLELKAIEEYIQNKFNESIDENNVLDEQKEKIDNLPSNMNTRQYIDFIKKEFKVKDISLFKKENKKLSNYIKMHMIKFGDNSTWIRSAKGLGFTTGTRDEIVKQLENINILDMNLQLLSNNNNHIDTLEPNLYTFTDDIECLNSDILEYNKQIEYMSRIKGTDALELYKIENKCNLEKRIEKVINENKIYNIKPIQIINIENDSIKKSYFDSKRNTYDDLLKSKDNNNSYHKSLSTYTVNKIFKFTNEDYDIITNNLMCHMNFLEGFGGSVILENGNYLNHLSILITNQNGEKGILIDPQYYPYARYVGVIDIETLKEYLKLSTNETQYNKNTAVSCKEVLKETEDYILFKKGNIYVLRYFDECFYHEKYDRNKKITQSRITKYYDNIKHLLE